MPLTVNGVAFVVVRSFVRSCVRSFVRSFVPTVEERYYLIIESAANVHFNEVFAHCW